MTNQEILNKAIEKAIVGGWNFFEDSTLLPIKDWIVPTSITVWNSYLNDKVHIPQQCVIFNHNFAKALWGEDETLICRFIKENGNQESGNNIFTWKMHLMKMVVAEDPIKYLGENL